MVLNQSGAARKSCFSLTRQLVNNLKMYDTKGLITDVLKEADVLSNVFTEVIIIISSDILWIQIHKKLNYIKIREKLKNLRWFFQVSLLNYATKASELANLAHVQSWDLCSYWTILHLTNHLQHQSSVPLQEKVSFM